MKFLANNRVSSLREVLVGNIQFARKWFLPLQQSEINNTRLLPEMQRELNGKLLLFCVLLRGNGRWARPFWDRMAAIQRAEACQAVNPFQTCCGFFGAAVFVRRV